MKKFKWGIIGPGKIAGKFAEDLKVVPGAELYAVASRSKERASQFAAEYGAIRSYGSYEELVKDGDVDVIYIATPHVYHNEHTLLCLKNGKAVLCEKPFAMDIAQVEHMIATAKENNVFLMEALWTNFLPHYKFLLELIESGEYGKVISLKAEFGFEAPFLPEKRLYNKALGGGSLMDIGIYTVFAALTIVGVPEEVTASAEICDTGVDESCTVELKYSNGATAQLFSTINKTIPTTAIIEMEEATILVKNRFHEPTSIIVQQNEKEKEFTFDVATRGYNYEAAHVQQMLAENRTESNVMTFQKSRDLIQILDKIRGKINLDYNT